MTFYILNAFSKQLYEILYKASICNYKVKVSAPAPNENQQRVTQTSQLEKKLGDVETKSRFAPQSLPVRSRRP